MEHVKKIGLIGGMSWHSTVEYYRVINQRVAEHRGGHASARISLQSVDFDEIRACQVAGDWDRAATLLAEAGRECERSGADVVLICTNLMHKVADQVQAAIDVPLLHIADALADRARAQGWDRLGVLGSKWVMEEEWYAGRLAAAGLTVDAPSAAERLEVDRVVFDELTLGRVEERSRAAYVDVVRGLQERGAQAVVLGCTEIELLLRPEDSTLPLLDSMRTHAEAAAEFALGSLSTTGLAAR
jgi:aspartate racemase